MEATRSLAWRKSSRSGSNGGGCVEFAETPGVVHTRDSKLGDSSPVLTFSQADWRAFMVEAKAGTYDLF